MIKYKNKTTLEGQNVISYDLEIDDSELDENEPLRSRFERHRKYLEAGVNVSPANSETDFSFADQELFNKSAV